MSHRAIAFLVVFTSALMAQSPVPFVQQPLQPSVVVPGGSEFVLTVHGSGFVSGAAVRWNAHPLVTTFVSATEISAVVPAANVATAGMVKISVLNSSGAVSNDAFFFISPPDSAHFQQKVRTTNARTNGMVAADFNADGKLDVALTDQAGGIEVFLGDGRGSFNDPIDYSVGSSYNTAIVAGDFNRDGKVDLATTYGVLAGTAAILIGNGDGTFQPHQDFQIARFPWSLVVGDFNKDGKLDMLAVCLGNQNGDGEFSLLRGNGDGTFAPHHDFPAIKYPAALAVGDFNVDGNLDVALVGGSSFQINVFYGNGDGTFLSPIGYSTGHASVAAIAADFNDDGLPDLVETVIEIDVVGVTVLLNQGGRTFGPPVFYETPHLSYPTTLIAADFNADGKLDLATADWYDALGPGAVSILLGNGDGTFTSHRQLHAAGIAPFGMAAGDFNRDGKPDLVVGYSQDDFLSTFRAQ